MKFTKHLNLKKPEYTDIVDIEDINSNMDRIDLEMSQKTNSDVMPRKTSSNKSNEITFTEVIDKPFEHSVSVKGGITNVGNIYTFPATEDYKHLTISIDEGAGDLNLDINTPFEEYYQIQIERVGEETEKTGWIRDNGRRSIRVKKDTTVRITGLTAMTVTVHEPSSTTDKRLRFDGKEIPYASNVAHKDDILTKTSQLHNDMSFITINDVPEFTDTITSINGKTGVITKDDIVALGIPSESTRYYEITTTEIDNGIASIPRSITARRLKYALDRVQEMISPLVNTLTETVAGKALDARQGKILDDKIKNISPPTVATKLEAEAGTNNVKMMTPLRVKESIESNPAWDNTKGSISGFSDTKIVTNPYQAQVNASRDSVSSNIMSQVNCSWKCSASGQRSQVNASQDCETNLNFTQVNCSWNVKPADTGTSVWGTGSKPSTQNIRVEVATKGTIKASGAITGNSSFADFAEYFESVDGKAIPLGTIVSLGEGGRVKVADQGEYMVGVISQTAGIILNAQGFEWKDRYLYDRYGQPILVDKEIINEETGEVEIIKTQMLNVNYKEDEEYAGREDREEWNVVGLTGQIFVNVDDTVNEGDFIKVGDNGIGTKGRNEYGQNWQVMKITTEYEKTLRFGIAMVFVR